MKKKSKEQTKVGWHVYVLQSESNLLIHEKS